MTAYNGAAKANGDRWFYLHVAGRDAAGDRLGHRRHADAGDRRLRLQARSCRSRRTWSQPLTGVTATLLNFSTSVGGTAKGLPYVGLKGCSGGKLKFKGTFIYTDGTSKTVTDTAACKK